MAVRRGLGPHDVWSAAMTCACGCGEQTSPGATWRPGHNRKDTPNRCGTPAGYSQHRRKREKACRPCLDSHARATTLWRATGKTRHVMISEVLFGELLAHGRPEVRRLAVEMVGVSVVERALRMAGAR